MTRSTQSRRRAPARVEQPRARPEPAIREFFATLQQLGARSTRRGASEAQNAGGKRNT